uniref:Glutathione peroxidase n=2 Tax=Arion vulgaris TaxID=1028688 RepID=A0A0B7AMG9_9EUPU
MNALLKNFKESQFTIVGFPCNQFGHQEPGDNSTEILDGLQYVRPGQGFKPHSNLHMMIKSDVNGDNETKVYTYLKASCSQTSTATFDPRESFWEPIHVNDIIWNFEKFLVSQQGVPLFRFQPAVEPFDLVEIIKVLMTPSVNLARQEKELNILLKDLDIVILDRIKM